MTTRRSLFSVVVGMAMLPLLKGKSTPAKTIPVIGTFDGERFVPLQTEKWFIIEEGPPIYYGRFRTLFQEVT
jgi:hypothetical protein